MTEDKLKNSLTESVKQNSKIQFVKSVWDYINNNNSEIHLKEVKELCDETYPNVDKTVVNANNYIKHNTK